MRSDFLGDCSIFPDLPEALNQGQFITPRLNRAQCQAAIEKPAAVFGINLEPGLVNRILNEIHDDPDQLPVMQHALRRLWERTSVASSNEGGAVVPITQRQYEEIGGVSRALSCHADKVFSQLSGEHENVGDKRTAQCLFRALSERIAEKRDTRRPTSLQTIADIAQVSVSDVVRVIESFRHPDCCFVTPALGTNLTPGTLVDISHESLIRNWDRMRKWVADEAQSASTFRRLADTARLWRDQRAELLHGRELHAVRDWYRTQQPNKTWASRYDQDWDLAIEFFGTSSEADQSPDAPPSPEVREALEFDVLLVHEYRDLPTIETLARRLSIAAGLRVFFFRSELTPGTLLQVELESALARAAQAVICFGRGMPHLGAGPELQTTLDRAAPQRDDFRVIPLLLPEATIESVPPFWRDRVSVDFRKGLEDPEPLRRLIAGIRGQALTDPTARLPDEPVPYRGLAAFGAEHARFFFGRDTEIAQLVRDLVRQRFVAVVGPAGCGKSSLVAAGLWTETAAKCLQSENRPVLSHWHVLTVRPGSEPLESLAAALAFPDRTDLSRRLIDELRRTDDPDQALRSILTQRFPNDDYPVLLIVDQLEELFTLGKTFDNPPRATAGPQRRFLKSLWSLLSGLWTDGRARSLPSGVVSPPVRPNDAELFIGNLLGVIRSGDARLHVIATVREDGRKHDSTDQGLFEILRGPKLVLKELPPESLRAAVFLPAQRVGAWLEQGLADRLLADLAHQHGTLSLLQGVLLNLWHLRNGPCLTLSAYEEIGGIGGTLGKIAVALSGGGYRAAAFHLGALDVLNATGMLADVAVLSTVSGGTLIGAAYAIAVARGKDFSTFYREFYEQLYERPLEQACHILLGTESSRLPAPTLIVAQAEAFDRIFFHQAKFGEILDASLSIEEIAFNATDISAGVPFRFQRSGSPRTCIGSGRNPIPRQVAAEMRLADIVAASMCFPFGFEPIEFPNDFHWSNAPEIRCKLAEQDCFQSPIPLLDGEGADIQGLDSVLNGVERLEAKDAADRVGIILISDANSPQIEPFLPPADKPRPGGLCISLVVACVRLLFFAAVTSSLSLGWHLARTVHNGDARWWPDLVTIYLPFGLSLILATSLWWIMNTVKTKLTDRLSFAASRFLGRLPVRLFIEFLYRRLQTMSAISNDVLRKVVRGLNDRQLRLQGEYSERTLVNLVYNLTESQYRPRTGSPEWLEPTAEMQRIAFRASCMDTVFWFENERQQPVADSRRATVC